MKAIHRAKQRLTNIKENTLLSLEMITKAYNLERIKLKEMVEY